MATGFYELLGLDPSAGLDEIRGAYQRRLAELVRRLRSARRQGADVRLLESQERELREAMEVLTDASRRRVYDSMRLAVVKGAPPSDAETLWEHARVALVDPLAHAALASLRALTDLPVGDPLPEPLSVTPRRPVLHRPIPELPRGLEIPRVSAPTPAEVVRADPPRVERVPEVVALPEPPAPAPPPVVPALAIPRAPAVPRSLDLPLPPPEADLLPMPQPSIAPPPTAAPPEAEPVGDEIERLRRRYGCDGRFLRAVRESRGLAIEDLARSTRISTRYLAAIEENGYDRLPATTFVKGYIRQIADGLGIADRGVVEGYMAVYAQHRG